LYEYVFVLPFSYGEGRHAYRIFLLFFRIVTLVIFVAENMMFHALESEYAERHGSNTTLASSADGGLHMLCGHVGSWIALAAGGVS